VLGNERVDLMGDRVGWVCVMIWWREREEFGC